ncbi:MAG: T9SS type A sorting domain-containing protein [Bacteroidota bacterium]
MRFSSLFVLLLAAALLAPAVTAQYYTQVRDRVDIAWPESNPIWEMEVYSPSNSSGTEGSGLEIRKVYYNGRKVFERAHVPIVNVEYDPNGGCGCYRDWNDFEIFFATEPESGGAPFLDAVPGSVKTTCDFDGQVDPLSDQGDMVGIAGESFDDRLVLTTQMAAGWYRYRVRWTFWSDGRIQPEFTFGHTFNVCTEAGRNHNAYWRFDFDIEGGEDDYVVERTPSGPIEFDEEAKRNHGDGISWGVFDRLTERGYVLTPGAETELVVDDFAYADAIVLAYDPLEIDDGGGFSAEYCAIDFESEGPPSPDPFMGRKPALLDGEDVLDTDVVLWYRTGTFRAGEGDNACRRLGPTLSPVGNWTAVDNEADAPALPQVAELTAAYPNPFERVTTVRFRVTEARAVTLTLVDDLGRTVRALYQGTPSPGQFVTTEIEAGSLPSGSYTVRLSGEGINETTRVVLLR